MMWPFLFVTTCFTSNKVLGKPEIVRKFLCGNEAAPLQDIRYGELTPTMLSVTTIFQLSPLLIIVCGKLTMLYCKSGNGVGLSKCYRYS